eukprot:gene1398-12018_t
MRKKKKKLLIIGSSVCAGAAPKDYIGWSQMLEKKIENVYETLNISVGGTNTVYWTFMLKQRSLLWKSFPTSKPDILIIGLSLANERIFENIEKYSNQFLEGLRNFANISLDFNIRVIFGGVYPNNFFEKKHYESLKRINEKMKSFDEDVIDFLTTTDNGNGQWKNGI